MSEQSGSGRNQDPHFMEPRLEDIARITDWMDTQLENVSEGSIMKYGNFELFGHEFSVINQTKGVLENGKLRRLTAKEAVKELDDISEEALADIEQDPEEDFGALGETDIFSEMSQEFEQTYGLPEIHINTAQGSRLGFKLFSDGSIRHESLAVPGDLNFDDLESDMYSESLGFNSLNHSQAMVLYILLEALYSRELKLRGQAPADAMAATQSDVNVFLRALTDAEFAEKFMKKHLVPGKTVVAPSAAMVEKVADSFTKLLALNGIWFNQSLESELEHKNAKVKILKQQQITESEGGLSVDGPRCYDMNITQKFPTAEDFTPGDELPEMVKTAVRINEYVGGEELVFTKLIQTDLEEVQTVITSVSTELSAIRQALEVDPDSEKLQTRFEQLVQLRLSLTALYAEEHSKNKELEYAARRESFEGAYSMSQADVDEVIELCYED